ncbi:transcriptional regulator [Streptomyces sp. Act143]|uniref:GAF and ANTAR domain-containing protein n=1 Tax=Streptomyces sp. Act143 TaxID=2200760 RepID=UPI000D6809C3|nr:GAF and ANTAR domain-containing protein [Streptomyces sp. Act143]PWI16903.1 transcriptional regulator [Streptomyces sp. Act143]
MSEQSREERLAAAFVELADTLVGDFDIIAFLHTLADHCVDLLDVTAAGVMLATPDGDILDASASDERTRALETDSLDWGEGPCLDCYRSGNPVPDTPLSHPQAHVKWPRFAHRAQELGFVSVAAAPMRLREQTIGSLNLFREEPGHLEPAQMRLGQALADVATIGILQQRAVHEHATVTSQLQTALDSRIIIEQAKGALAHMHGINAEEAFHQLRRYARHHRRRLTDVAREVMDGGIDVRLPAQDQ